MPTRMSARTRNAASWDVSRSAYRKTPRPTLKARTATTAAVIATMLGCWEARASRKPETASSATPQPVAAAPAATARSSCPRIGRARRSTRRRGAALATASRTGDRHQSRIGEPTLIEREHTRGGDPGAVAVASEYHRALGRHGLDDRQNLACAFRVKVGGRLVQQHELRVSQERPGERDSLPLASGQVKTALSQRGVEATGKGRDELLGAGEPGRPLDRAPCRMAIGERYVLCDRP